LVSGCASTTVPSLRQPERLNTIEDEMAFIQKEVTGDLLDKYLLARDKPSRNSYITARMYAIDMYYTKYESQLTHELQETSFFQGAVVQALTTAGVITTSAAGTKILTALAGGVNGVGASYNEKVLLSKSMQNVQTQMRANRSEQAAFILGNMKCDITAYPMGMALSDLEAYYRAGTFTAGLIKLSDTVNKAEADAKAQKEVQAPAPPDAAKAKLAGDGEAKAAQAAPSKCKLTRPTE
jgi:hypothetical protein